MHGYKTDTVDITVKCYIDLTGNKDDIIPNSYLVSVNDILTKSFDGQEIVSMEKYPLLNRTLITFFTYLFLRLCNEKKLVTK